MSVAAVMPVAADPAPSSVGLAVSEELAADVLVAVVGGEVAWSTPDELLAALGWGEAGELAIRAAESLGWLAYWPDCPQGPAWTLSVAAADRLGVAIGPDGVWVDAGSVQADGNYSGRRMHGRHAGPGSDTEGGDHERSTLAWCVDPRAIDPSEAAAEADRLAELAKNPRIKRLLAGTALPTRVVGLAPIWPARPVGGVCPGCGTGPTAVDCVCVICHRSGLDRMVRGGRR